MFKMDVGERTFPKLEDLEELLDSLKSQLTALCMSYHIEDLSNLKYWTVAESRVQVHVRGKFYQKVQLKGYYGKDGRNRSRTIKSWSVRKAPRDLGRLVLLYRACKSLDTAIQHLYALGQA